MRMDESSEEGIRSTLMGRQIQAATFDTVGSEQIGQMKHLRAAHRPIARGDSTTTMMYPSSDFVIQAAE
jgi:hypothetical protein